MEIEYTEVDVYDLADYILDHTTANYTMTSLQRILYLIEKYTKNTKKKVQTIYIDQKGLITTLVKIF